MGQAFRRKILDNKYITRLVVCFVGLLWLFAGSVCGQNDKVYATYNAEKKEITIENKSEYLLVLFKNDETQGEYYNQEGKIKTVFKRSGLKNLERDELIRSEKMVFSSNTQISITGFLCKVVDKKKIVIKEIIIQCKTENISGKKIEGHENEARISKKENNTLPIDTPLQITQPVAPTTSQISGNINDKDRTDKNSSKTEKSKQESKSINYNDQIAKLENQAKKFDYALSWKEEDLDSVKREVLSKDSLELVDLLSKTKTLGKEIDKKGNATNKQNCTERLSGLEDRLIIINNTIIKLLSPLPREVKDSLISLFKTNFRAIDSQFEKINNYIKDNRYKDSWYNWIGKKKYEKILDSLERNKENYISSSTAFIDSICKDPKYEAGRVLLNNEQQNLLWKFDKIENYRQILKTDFAVPIAKLSIFAALFILIIVVLIILIGINVRNKRVKRIAKEKEREQEEKLGKSSFKKIDDTNHEGIAIPSTEKPKFKQLFKQYEHDLTDVKSNVGKFYKEINMFDFVDSSSIHKVYISRDFIKELYKFFNEFLKSDGSVPETGCYIIGRWDYAPNTGQQAYDISLEYIVKPGKDAKYSKYECEFGAEIGTALVMENRKYSEQENIEYVHTSWMHSHPGLQLFLSSQDLIVQSTLTNNSPYKRMLAIVIDTNTEDLEMAFFSPKSGIDKAMNNDKDIKKTVTLDELHDWAETEYIEPQQEQKITKIIGTPAKEYFAIPVTQETGKLDEIKLTRAVIVEISTGNEGVLCGKSQGRQLFIDAFVENNSNNQNEMPAQVGVFKKISGFENDAEWEAYKQMILDNKFWESNQILAIYCFADKKMYFFTEKLNDTLETQNLINSATVIPFQELKKWTREKRS